MSESLLQVATFNWFTTALPDVLFFHCYNENAVNAIQGKIKKDRGVVAGIHDNHLVWRDESGPRYATLELKDPNKPKSANKYSEKQEAIAERLTKYGVPHACCQNGRQIEEYVRSLGLVPKYPFPSCLSASAKQMLMMEIVDAMKP